MVVPVWWHNVKTAFIDPDYFKVSLASHHTNIEQNPNGWLLISVPRTLYTNHLVSLLGNFSVRNITAELAKVGKNK